MNLGAADLDFPSIPWLDPTYSIFRLLVFELVITRTLELELALNNEDTRFRRPERVRVS